MDEIEQAEKRLRELFWEEQSLIDEASRLRSQQANLADFYKRRSLPSEQATNRLRRRIADIDAEADTVRSEINRLRKLIKDSNPL